MLCGLPALSGCPQLSLPVRAGARPRSPCALPVAWVSSTERGIKPQPLYLKLRRVMRRARERSVAARASSRLSVVIAHEPELPATRRLRLLAFGVEEIEALAGQLAARVASARPSIGLIEPREAATAPGCTVSRPARLGS
jgi:hypothetical protein